MSVETLPGGHDPTRVTFVERVVYTGGVDACRALGCHRGHIADDSIRRYRLRDTCVRGRPRTEERKAAVPVDALPDTCSLTSALTHRGSVLDGGSPSPAGRTAWVGTLLVLWPTFSLRGAQTRSHHRVHRDAVQKVLWCSPVTNHGAVQWQQGLFNGCCCGPIALPGSGSRSGTAEPEMDGRTLLQCRTPHALPMRGHPSASVSGMDRDRGP